LFCFITRSGSLQHGNAKKNLLPTPTSLSIQMRPP
jgi:hypothetical protein